MPGPAIAKLLNPYTYETFHKVASDYSELLLGTAVYIRPSSAIILRKLQALATNAFDDKITGPTLERTLQEFAERGQDLNTQIRYVFWNYEPGRRVNYDAAALEKNRQRWQPYDEGAWDQFFGEVTEQLTPILQRLSDLRSPLRLLDKWPNPNGLGAVADREKAAELEMIGSIRSNLERTVDRLQVLLDANGLDDILAETAHRS